MKVHRVCTRFGRANPFVFPLCKTDGVKLWTEFWSKVSCLKCLKLKPKKRKESK